MMRHLEAYIGEYASGKTEVAINRALALLKSSNARVRLVDLDIVEPCYTIRIIKKELEAEGLDVVAWDTKDLIGLGEVGNLLHRDAANALNFNGDIVFDVGYGVSGRDTLKLVRRRSLAADEEIKTFAVVNAMRPMTSSVPLIVEYLEELGEIDGIVNNTHLGDETSMEHIRRGISIIAEASEKLGIPVTATAAEEPLAAGLRDDTEFSGTVWPLRLRMRRAIW